MRRIVWLIPFLLLLFPNTVKAYQCTQTQWNILNEFSKNISTVVEEEIDENGNMMFSVTFTGVYPKFKIVNRNFNMDYLLPDLGELEEIELKGLSPGYTYNFEIRGLYYCYRENFKSVTINLPHYNKYANEAICEDAREYSLCQKWVKVDESYEEFVTKVQEYKDGLKKDTTVIPSDKDKFSFYDKYYWPCLISLIIFFSILVILWIRENSKNKL